MRELEIGYLARHAPIMDGVRHAERTSRRRGKATEAALVMTAIQAHYAQYLVRATRGMAMSTLAAHTRTTPANVSQIVRRMERHGLVRRDRSPTDGRSVVVRLTARGAHQFWQLLRRLRAVERGYRADARTATVRHVPAVLRALTGPPPRLAPPAPTRWRRIAPRRAAGP